MNARWTERHRLINEHEALNRAAPHDGWFFCPCPLARRIREEMEAGDE